MKVAELRAELASRGMDTKGKKAELEARLQALETAVLGADGADASTCIAAPAPGPKTTVAGLRAELASRGLDTKGKKAELEARLLEPEASAAQLTTELRDLKAEHKAERKAKLAKHKAKLSALEAEHKAEVAATEAEHRAKEAALAAALVAQQTKEHKALEFEEWCKEINDASFDGSMGKRMGYDAGAEAVAAIVASGKGALIRDIDSCATDLVDTDVAALAEHCGELSSIDLDHCAHLTNAAVAAFADACRRRGACSGATGQLGSITFRGCNLIDEGALGAVGTLEGCGVKVEHTIGEVWVRCTNCEESVKEEEDALVECAAEGCSATICADCSEQWAPCAECGDKFCDNDHMHYCDGDNLACYCKDGQRGYRKGCDETFCTSCAKDHEHDPAWVANALAGYPVDLGGEW